ncbi:osiris 3 [Arctopsyche grandis]|uniref:osiris 3 n=1 Tax=Arctopsyche grandis TaxID=121162 RepID=UPI00406D6946
MKIVCAILFVILAVGLSKGDKEINGKNVQNIVRAQEGNNLEDILIRKLNVKCSQREVSSCLILKLVTYMNRMLKKAAIQIGDDVEITQNSSNVESNNNEEDLARNGSSDDDQATQLLLNKLWTFVKTRSLKWRIFDDAELVVKNSPDADGSMNIGMSIKSVEAVENGRGKMKNMGPFLAAAAMKIGLLGGLAFKGLVLLVGKALLVSKIALLLAGIIGLKKLFSHQKHVTYEVLSHPHHGHEASGHDTYSSGWGRGLGADNQYAQELAYSAHVPQDAVEVGESVNSKQVSKEEAFVDTNSQ